MPDDARRRRLLLLVKILPPIVLLLVVLAGMEIFARVLYSRPSMHFGLEMWKYARQLKIRAENDDMSHRHRPNTHAFLMGVDVNINSLGLRDHDVSLQKPPDTFRIVVLGDSTTFGWGVHFDKTDPKLLERSLNANPPCPRCKNYEVLNADVGNYNTAQELASFKEQWLALNPDMVLIGWYINDAEPATRPTDNWLAYHSYGYVWLTANFDAMERNVGVRKSYRGLYAAGQPGWKAC